MKRKLIISLVMMLTILSLISLLVQAEVKEDIINFSNQNVKVVQVNNRWKITANNSWLLDFAGNKNEAMKALRIIKFYKLNQMCFVGRPDPSMRYFLSSGKAPAGPMQGEDSIYFDNNKLRVRYIDNCWYIIEDDDHYLLNFDKNEDEAWTALRIIWKYDFNYICFVGRPGPSMVYFRK